MDAGVADTANCGEIALTCGLPLVDGPSVEVTCRPSLTICVTDAGRFGSMVTVKCRSTEPPAGIVTPLQLTEPPLALPPSSTLLTAVWSGTGSVTDTPVAGALPTLRMCSVYGRSTPGPTGVPGSLICATRAGETMPVSSVQPPRPWVPATSGPRDGS